MDAHQSDELVCTPYTVKISLREEKKEIKEIHITVIVPMFILFL